MSTLAPLLWRQQHVCISCDSTAPHRYLLKPPEDTPCQHPIDACSVCWEEWIQHQLNLQAPSQLECIQCPTILRQNEVRAYSSDALFQRYLDLELKATLAAVDGFLFCNAPGCDSGQMHDGGDIFTCVKCSNKQCVTCSMFWHEGTTCEEAQAETAMRETRDAEARRQEEKSEQTISETTKKCPGCKVNIEKNDGCDHMRCTSCPHEFCWLCLADYEPIRREGNHRHNDGCRYLSSLNGPLTPFD